MKKIISLLLALVMVMGLAVCASADETPVTTGSITITPGTTADHNNAGETYKAYLLFTATMANDITTVPGSATDTTTPVAYEIAADSVFLSALDAFENNNKADVFTFEEIEGDDTKLRVKKNADYDAADLAKALADANLLTDGNSIETVSTMTDGKYVFSGLAKGYYLITSSLGSKMIVDTLGNVEVATKNEYPSMTMQIVDGTNLVDSITAGYGGTITFEVTVTVPGTINKNIIVHDVLDADLQNIQLVEPDGVSVVTNKTDTDCSQEFEIDYSKATNGKFTFRFTAQLKGDAATATAHPNTAWLTYSNFRSVSTTVNVYTYEFDVFKYTKSGDAENPLAGAGFVLMNSEKKYYSKNTDGIVTWVDTITDDIVKTTGNEGKINFDGLANGEYTLIEHVVPAGYNKADDEKVTINNANKTNNEIKVLNSTGSELPSTGGIGTTLFYVIGGLLMVGAVVVMVTKKRIS